MSVNGVRLLHSSYCLHHTGVVISLSNSRHWCDTTGRHSNRTQVPHLQKLFLKKTGQPARSQATKRSSKARVVYLIEFSILILDLPEVRGDIGAWDAAVDETSSCTMYFHLIQ